MAERVTSSPSVDSRVRSSRSDNSRVGSGSRNGSKDLVGPRSPLSRTTPQRETSDASMEGRLRFSGKVSEHMTKVDTEVSLTPPPSPKRLDRMESPDSFGAIEAMKRAMSPSSSRFELASDLPHRLLTKASRPSVTDSRTSKKSTASAFIAFSSGSSITQSFMPYQKTVKNALCCPGMDLFIGIVVLVNFILICVDTDARAGGKRTPTSVLVGMQVCLGVYVVEFCARVFIERSQVMNDTWNGFDLAIIVCSLLEMCGIFLGHLALLRVLRLFRLVRLARQMHVFSGFFRELSKLMQMMMSCCRTLFWSFVMCFVAMTFWAALAVEMLDELLQDMEVEQWNACERCRRSFSTVMGANLTLFQTVVAGDSWGLVAVPVIEAHPWTAFIFMGALLTIIFGVLNLVVAVIVDSFAELRAKDTNALASDLDWEEQHEKLELMKMFQKIDADGSGAVSYDELREGARKVPEFRHRLRVMDIDAEDLRQLFDMLDSDHSGTVELQEFIEQLYRIRHSESKTKTCFTNHHVMVIRREQQRIWDKIADLQKVVSAVTPRLPPITPRKGRGDESALLGQTEQQLEAAIRSALKASLDASLENAIERVTNAMTSATVSLSAMVRGHIMASADEPLPLLKGPSPAPPSRLVSDADSTYLAGEGSSDLPSPHCAMKLLDLPQRGSCGSGDLKVPKSPSDGVSRMHASQASTCAPSDGFASALWPSSLMTLTRLPLDRTVTDQSTDAGLRSL